MKKVFVIFVFLAAISCSPKFKIQSDKPFPGDFNSYQTFKFFNPANMPASNFSFDESLEEVIFDAIADEMKARNYASVQDADLMIKVQGGTKGTVEVRNDDRFYPNSNFNYHDRYGRYYDPYDTRPRDESKKESSIIIDIIDIEKDKIVWQGVGIGSFGKHHEIDELQIREAIIAIFAEYPYKAAR